MATTIHFGTNITEFPLASTPVISNGGATIQIVKSETATAEAVYNAANGADSFTVTVDGTAEPTQTGYKYGSLSYGDIITVIMQKLTDEQLQIRNLAEEQLNIQLTIALMGDVNSYSVGGE